MNDRREETTSMNDKNKPAVEVFKSEESLLLDHNYDGIRELDHVLPRWWLWLLYATIVFAAWYSGYYMSGFGPTPQQELAVELKKIDALRPPEQPTTGFNEAELLAAVGKPELIKSGKEVFAGKCVSCHGDLAQGVIGPNLTDEFWIQGKGTLQGIAKVVTDGVAEKGMPPWGAILTKDETRDVVVYIHSIQGSRPAGAKDPQGEKQEAKN